MKNQGQSLARIGSAVGCLAVLMLLAGCESSGPAPQPEGVLMRLAPEQAGSDAGAAAGVASLWVPKLPAFELKDQESTAQFSKLVFTYKDKKGNPAAYLMVAVIFGEADQSLEEKFTTLVDEDKVTVKDVGSYKPSGEPENITTAAGLPGQVRVFTFLDEKGQKQLHGFALLDMRKKDAVYARVQLVTLEANFKTLDPQFRAFLQQIKRVGS